MVYGDNYQTATLRYAVKAFEVSISPTTTQTGTDRAAQRNVVGARPTKPAMVGE